MMRFLTVAYLLVNASTCFAFEPGFYGHTPTLDPIRHKLFSVLNTADQCIKCLDIDEIDVGIGEVNNNGRSPIYFKRSQIHQFLKNQREKRLLVIYFLKPVMYMEPRDRQEIISAFKTFVADLGFKRVLIVGAAAVGTYVVYDSEQPVDNKAIQENPEPNQR